MPWVACLDADPAGSEGGKILMDEEYAFSGRDGETVLAARITLEQIAKPPFAITCGIYGSMVHTTWANGDADASSKYTAMKDRLAAIVEIWSGDGDPDELREAYNAAMSAFVEDFR
jgi:hypothetical protein